MMLFFYIFGAVVTAVYLCHELPQPRHALPMQSIVIGIIWGTVFWPLYWLAQWLWLRVSK